MGKKKQDNVEHSQRKYQELPPQEPQTLGILDKDFKSIVLNMLKELKKIRRLMYEKNREYQYGNRQFQNKTNINSEAGKKKTNN